ncbi:MAG: hypothetical protein WCG85_25995 [Polyangia bacterium]
MEKTAVKVQRYLIIASILALAAFAEGCSSSSATRPNAGGTPAGGTSEAGGMTATGGTPVSGGTTTPTGGTTTAGGTTAAAGTSGASTGPSCTPAFSPDAPLITDFSSGPAGWHAGLGGGKWGAIGVLTGSIFSFAGTASTFPATDPLGRKTMSATVDTTNQDLVLAGDVAAGDYAGGGMSFDQCVNTTVYTGVQFTLGGTVAGCDLYAYVQTFDEKEPGQGQVGGCTTGCYVFPGEKLTSTTGAVTVHFSDLKGGQLITATSIANEIVGLQWQFNSPAPVGDGGQSGCTGVALTITNVSFVSN